MKNTEKYNLRDFPGDVVGEVALVSHFVYRIGYACAVEVGERFMKNLKPSKLETFGGLR